MPAVASINDGELSLAIEGELSIYTVAELKARLERALGDCRALQIDLAAVTEMDAAGVQLLFAVTQEARRRATPLRLKGCSEAVRAVFGLCGMTEHFCEYAPDLVPQTAHEMGRRLTA